MTLSDVLSDIHSTFTKMYNTMSFVECKRVFTVFVYTPVTLKQLMIFRARQGLFYNMHRKEQLEHQFYAFQGTYEEEFWEKVREMDRQITIHTNDLEEWEVNKEFQ